MLIKVTNGAPTPYSVSQLRRDNPQTSFAETIPLSVLEGFSVYPVLETAPPEIDSKTHRHTQSVERVNGQWTQTWVVTQLPKTMAAENVRAHRNSLLMASDWTQLPDVSASIRDAWAIYRQALRDITVQAGFPWNVIWPAEPE